MFSLLVRVVLLSSMVFALPVAAAARCSAGEDLSRLGSAIRGDLRCGAAAGTAECLVSNVPTCGADAFRQIRKLATGSADGARAGGSRDEVGRCRSAIANATGLFAQRRLQERRRGLRGTRGGRIPDVVASVCDGVDAGALSVGEACSPLLDRAKRGVDGPALARCLRAATERIVDEVAPAALRPNIVLVLTDDQRWDTVGYMPETFERIAGQGLSFQNAFATTPSCSPSRASIYSGKIARRHGVVANGREPAFDASRTIATALAGRGYRNAFFGKYLNGAEALGPAPPPGWDEWNVFLRPSGGSYFSSRLNENGVVRQLGEDEYSTDLLGERAVDFIRANAAEPFFVVYAPYAPHDPSTPAARHDGAFATLAPHRPPNWREADLSLKPRWVRFFSRILGPEGAARRERQRIQELETLLSVDEAIGSIVDTLEREGLTDETLLVFASDHGIHWGEHWTGTKFSSYEESIRMPLLVRYPARLPVARAAVELVANIDLAPTFADVAGARPAGMDGRSLMPLLDGNGRDAGVPWRDAVAIESTGGLITAPSRALRTARWKYIDVGTDDGIAQELYDLEADPYELQNLAFDPAFEEIRASLSTRLEAELPSDERP